MKLPLVSVVAPVRNEEDFIARTVKSILEQDYPMELLDVAIVDGLSDDGTTKAIRDLIGSWERGSPRRFEILENPSKWTPAAMNIGLAWSEGDVVILVGGHCQLNRSYVRRCVETLADTGADCVGGCLTTVGHTRVARAIARAQSSWFGVGGAAFRTDKIRRGRHVDTVAFGAYRKTVFDRIGGFDEDLIRNQDDELNFRLVQSGGKIWMDPSISSIYYSRSTLRRLWRQYYDYGLYKVRVMQKRRRIPAGRHVVPGLFVFALATSFFISATMRKPLLAVTVAGPYTVANIIASLWSGRRDPRTLPLLPLAYAIVHVAYGLGFLRGVIRWRRYFRSLPASSVHSQGAAASHPQSTSGTGPELARIASVYESYRGDPRVRARWSDRNPGNRFIVAERMQALRDLLLESRFWPLKDLRILELGCGNGNVLRNLLDLGASPSRLVGLDLLGDRVRVAADDLPGTKVLCADGRALPFADGSFDLVVAFTVFSSIPGRRMRRSTAQELERVLVSDGAVLWYDIRYANPSNPDTRPISRSELAGLFPAFELGLRSVTLLPPLSRRLGRLTDVFYPALVSIPALRSHYIGLLGRFGATTGNGSDFGSDGGASSRA